MFIVQGGLVTETDSSKLIIALEPEAASVWCKQLPSDGFISEGLDNEILEQKPGAQYIVVDCGGKGLILYRNPVQSKLYLSYCSHSYQAFSFL